MLRSMLLAAGRSARLQAAAEGSAVLRPLVDRFVAGTDLDGALPVIAGLATDRLVTVDHLGENTTDRSGAEATVAAYRALAAAAGRRGARGAGRGVGEALRARPGPARR